MFSLFEVAPEQEELFAQGIKGLGRCAETSGGRS